MRPLLAALALALTLASLAASAADEEPYHFNDSLRWLVRHQAEDGAWSPRRFALECPTGATVCAGAGDARRERASTAWALLALMNAGYTHLSRETYADPFAGRVVGFGEAVKRGTVRLISLEGEDGCVGPREGDWLEEHALATIAISEEYGMTSAAFFGEEAGRATRFLEKQRRPDGAWGARGVDSPADLRTTLFAIMALTSARISGLEPAGLTATGEWLDAAIDPVTALPRGAWEETARVGDDASVAAARAGVAAQALLVRLFVEGLRAREAPFVDRQLALVTASAAAIASGAAPADPLREYLCTIAVFQYLANGPGWKAWEAMIHEALLARVERARDGCAYGSFPSAGEEGPGGGRVAATALSTITLEIRYRWESVFKEAPAKDSGAPSPGEKREAPAPAGPRGR